MDYLELKNGVPDMNICDSLENGVITLYNRIKSRVNSEYDLLLSESEIDDIIQGKKTDFNEQIQGLVRNITKTFVDDLLGAFRERSMDLRTGCVVFVGGGALLLREHLERSEKWKKSDFFIPEINGQCARLCQSSITFQKLGGSLICGKRRMNLFSRLVLRKRIRNMLELQRC